MSNVINPDGLRYTKKKPDQTFLPGGRDGGFGKAAISCFLCGKHFTREFGMNRKIIGRSHFVCFGCKPESAQKN